MLQITRSLHRNGTEIDVLSLNPAKQHADPDELRRQIPGVRVDAVDIDTSRVLTPLARAPMLGAPWLVSRFHSPRFAGVLKQRLSESRYDVVHIESPFLLSYLPLIRAGSDALVAMRAQNVEFRIWESLARHERNPVRRALMRRIARGLRSWERDAISRCDALVPISEEDAADFRTEEIGRPMHVMPCGADAAPSISHGDPRAFYFIGSMSYRPNQEALRWIATELWPLVLRSEPRARLVAAGSAFPPALRELAVRAGIEVAGEVGEVRAFAAPFGAMLAPLFSGSGMRIKVLEAMAIGKPVVATPMGAAGIEAEPGRDILIGDDARALASLVVGCIREPDAARAIGDSARQLVAAHYDPDLLGAELVAFYERLLRSAS